MLIWVAQYLEFYQDLCVINKIIHIKLFVTWLNIETEKLCSVKSNSKIVYNKVKNTPKTCDVDFNNYKTLGEIHA